MINDNVLYQLHQFSIEQKRNINNKQTIHNSLCHILLILIYSLTPWGKVLLEKLTGLQLVKKYPTFYET